MSTIDDPRYASVLREYFANKRPKPPQSKTWAPSAIHVMLRNRRYLGFIPYGGMRNQLALDDGPRRVRAEQQFFPASHLRIIDEKLAAAVKQRSALMRREHEKRSQGSVGGRCDAGRPSRYLLSGLMKCAVCGNNMIIESHGVGNKKNPRRMHRCVCGFNHNRGASACSNAHKIKMQTLDAHALDAIEQKVLRPDVLLKAARRASAMIRKRSGEQPDLDARLRKELAKTERERDRRVEAVANGAGESSALLAALGERETRIKAISSELARCCAAALPDNALSNKRLEKELLAIAQRWREWFLSNQVERARAAIRALMVEPIVFEPHSAGYTLRGARK